MATASHVLATDTTLQATNTALGLLGKDTSVQAIATAIGNLPNATQAAADNANAAAAAATTAAASIAGIAAETYSSSETYKSGEYAYYSGNLYRCLTDITTAEEFTASHWAKVPLGGELYDLKKALQENIPTSVPMTWESAGHTTGGLTYTYIGGNTYKVSGQNEVASFMNVFAYEKLSDAGIAPGDVIAFYVDSSSPNDVYMNLWWKKGDQYEQYISAMKNGYCSYVVPSDATGITHRIYVPARNSNLTATIHAEIITFPKSQFLVRSFITSPLGDYGATVDLNNIVKQNQRYLLSDNRTYQHTPVGFTVGFLECYYTGNFNLQLLFPYSGAKMYKRSGNTDGSTWEEWREVAGGGNSYNITNNNTFNEYSQEVTLTASPSITTDTNNYLASTGDTTDRTSDILTMLTSSKVCRLGPGKYYVANLQMPDDSSIIGSGFATEIHMSGTSDGYTIKLGTECTVKDVRLIGADSTPTFSSTAGGRNGFLWQGTYTSDSGSPKRSILDNVYITNFTGGGITCYDTGMGVLNCIEVTNAYITNCWAGINISYYSEFNKFTNVHCSFCYIGCVNNGGSNLFANCNFTANHELGLLIDNSQGTSTNNSHSSCVGCIFGHTGHNGVENTGVGIKILNAPHGFVFTGCQIFFSQIYIEDSDGVIFGNCNFGYSNCDITINNGGAVLFNGGMFQAKPPISVSNNQKVHFVDCYVRSTGAVVGP